MSSPTSNSMSGESSTDESGVTANGMMGNPIEERPQAVILVQTIFVSVITLQIIVTNIINIAVWSTVKQIAPATKLFLINLSVSDLLVGTIACAPAVYSVYTGIWPYGPHWCQVSGISHGTSVTISIWSISLVAIDRFIAVTWPLKYQIIVTTRRCEVILAVLWAFAVSTFAAPVFTRDDFIYYQFDLQYGLCGLYWVYPVFCVVTGGYIPVLCGSILLFTSIKIARALKKSGNITSKDNKARQAQNKRALNVIIVTSVVYFLCWGPYVTLVIAEALSPAVKAWSPDWLSFITIWAANTNSGLNVFIYSLTNSAFKNQFKRLLSPVLGKCFPRFHQVGPETSFESGSTNMSSVAPKKSAAA